MTGGVISIGGSMMVTSWFPSKKPALKKLYFNLVRTDGPTKQFQRLSFQLLNNKDLVLVQYVGDYTLVEEFPYQNSKSNEKSYVRVCPSVISNIKLSDPSEPPSQTYKKQMRVDNPPQLDTVLKPTFTQQVSNHKAVER